MRKKVIFNKLVSKPRSGNTEISIKNKVIKDKEQQKQGTQQNNWMQSMKGINHWNKKSLNLNGLACVCPISRTHEFHNHKQHEK